MAIKALELGGAVIIALSALYWQYDVTVKLIEKLPDAIKGVA